jgi:hypothetical protein
MPIVNNLCSALRLTILQPIFVGSLLLSLLLPDVSNRPASAQPPAGGTAAGNGAAAADSGAAEPAAKTYAPPQPIDNTKKIIWTKVTEALHSGKFASDAERAAFEDYFRLYCFPQWTQANAGPSIAVWRGRLINQVHQVYNKPGDPHELFNARTLEIMDAMAKTNFAPVVRVNAMLLIGELNAVEAVTLTGLPTPLPAAVPILVAAIEDPNQIDAVRAAALVGLLRHAKFNGLTDATLRTQVAGAMLKLVRNGEIPAGQTPEGHAWIRGQAAEILGYLGMVGTNAAVPNALAAMVADPKLSLSSRCTAANALGRLNYQEAGGNVNATPWISALAEMVLNAPQDTKASSRRKLRSCLYTVLAALNGDDQHPGMNKLAPETTELRTGIQVMADALDNKLKDDELAAKLAEARTKIQKVVKKEG